MPTFLSYEKVNKTRKPHTCFACLGKIEQGSKAYRWTSIDDVIFTSYLHDKCGEIVQNECFTCKDCMDFDGYQEGFLKECLHCGSTCKACMIFNQNVKTE